MISGFCYHTHSANGVEVAYCIGGSGPPLLLLHGFPQTHMLWAQIAPKLAQNFTVVCADLRGYGASAKPHGTENYSFRAMGQDQLSLMSALGFARFHLAGHDRGGRVAHRIALDAPQRVTSLTVMDIIPTHHLLEPPNRITITAGMATRVLLGLWARRLSAAAQAKPPTKLVSSSSPAAGELARCRSQHPSCVR